MIMQYNSGVVYRKLGVVDYNFDKMKKHISALEADIERLSKLSSKLSDALPTKNKDDGAKVFTLHMLLEVGCELEELTSIRDRMTGNLARGTLMFLYQDILKTINDEERINMVWYKAEVLRDSMKVGVELMRKERDELERLLHMAVYPCEVITDVDGYLTIVDNMRNYFSRLKEVSNG